MNATPKEWETCLRVLQQIADDPATIHGEERMKALIAKIHREGKRDARRTVSEANRVHDRQLRSETGIVQQQTSGVSRRIALEGGAETLPVNEANANSEAKNARSLHNPAFCYICKRSYTELHRFYHLLCPECADFNFRKRGQRTVLIGRVALVTGGRIKIGFHTTLRMLRDGAKVIVTTRFPRDAARQFAKEADFDHWRNRLQIVGLDFRNLHGVEAFTQYLLTTESSLDILVNNAAQTIMRPAAYYRSIIAGERTQNTPLSEAEQSLLLVAPSPTNEHGINAEAENYGSNALRERPIRDLDSLALWQREWERWFPANAFDAEGQPLDLRPVNSWRLRLNEIGTGELLETQCVNVVAPFLLASRLKPLFLRSPFARRFIVNVSAMEGQFGRESKTEFHPHTNMAKAALNMMTRTSAQDYARDGIYMNSVDTGWITDENPHDRKTDIQTQHGFYTPLDALDGMARIYDPIARGINESETPVCGQFLKDYVPHPW